MAERSFHPRSVGSDEEATEATDATSVSSCSDTVASTGLRRRFSCGSLMSTLTLFGTGSVPPREDLASHASSSEVSSASDEGYDPLASRGVLMMNDSTNPERSPQPMSLLLYFKDLELEKAYMAFHYGSTKSTLKLAFPFLIATLMFLVLLVTEDIGIVPLELYLPRVFCTLVFALLSLLSFLPLGLCRVHWLVELCIIFLGLFGAGHTLIRDIFRFGLDGSVKNRPVGFVYILIGVAVLVTGRFIISAVSSLIFVVGFTSFLVWFYFAKGERVDVWFWVSQHGFFWITTFVALSVVYVLHRSQRILFLSKIKLEEKAETVRVRAATSKGLLGNILPMHFVDLVEDGELEKKSLASIKADRIGDRGDETCSPVSGRCREDDLDSTLLFKLGCLVEAVPAGAVVEADLVGFTAWAVHCSSERVVRTVNEYIALFDVLADSLGIEKVRTIGDAWLGFVASKDSYDDIVCFGITLIAGTRLVNEAVSSSSSSSDSDSASSSSRLSIRVGIAGGKLHLAVQGSVETSVVFDIVGRLPNGATELEGAAAPDSLRMNFCVAEAVGSSFAMSWLDVDVAGQVEVDVGSSESDGDSEEQLVLEPVVDAEENQMSKRFDGTGVIRVGESWQDVVKSSELIQRISESLEEAKTGGEREHEHGENKTEKVIPKKKKKVIKCVSETGLIYPLLCFRRVVDEYAAQRDFHEARGSGLTAFYFVLPVLTSLLYLLLYGSDRGWTMFLQFNLFITVTYIKIFIDVVLVIFFLICRIAKYNPPILVYWICFGVHSVFLFAEAAMASVDGFLVIDVCSFIFMMHMTLLVLDSGLLTMMKYALFGLHVILFMIDWWWLNFDGALSEASMARIPTLLAAPLVFFLGTIKKELSVKLSYESRLKIDVKMAEEEEERERNERLLKCVLPPAIVSVLYKLRGRTFVSSMDRLFVCAARCDLSSEYVSASEERHVRSVAAFSTLLQSEFDDAVAAVGRCIRIKTFLSSFLFISRTSGLDGLLACLETVAAWKEAFKRCVREYCRWKDVDFDVESVRFRSGLASGDFHSGIFGRNRFSFDILGVPVNLASRLASASTHLKTTVSDQNLHGALRDGERQKAFESLLDVTPRGRAIALKGFGDVDCSFVSLRKKRKKKRRRVVYTRLEN